MLKALEIIGFKSFADRTRFEFRPGITAIVGPNGSGKSNVVDAIKWVLGEQSVKNLRGKEMTDVIFNGSATRRPLNYAEITLTLDNSRGILPVETPEVHITRRLYRSGDSEYLINRQPCRLRDIRDLLAGTGLGTQAYSVIEQGKIDQLLQATPLERRVVFEEAAGISRFKSRKLEAQRRLERLEQNLVRLHDIVEEVESRLRVVRSQAGKAQRYQKYAEELRGLRVHLARLDWQRLNGELETREKELQEVLSQQQELLAEGEILEQQLAAEEARQTEIDQYLGQLQKGVADQRERIATLEAEAEHDRSRQQELERDLTRLRKTLAGLTLRAESVQSQRQSVEDALANAEAQYRELLRQIAEGEHLLTERLELLDRRRGEYEQLRTQHWEALQRILAADAEIRQLDHQLQQTESTRQRLSRERDHLTDESRELIAAQQSVQQHQSELVKKLQEVQRQVHAADEERQRRQRESQDLQRELDELQQRRAAARERAKLLQEWEDQLEGLDSGVRDFLQRVRSAPESAGGVVCGLVADVFQVELQAALLVDAALGEAAQWVVLREGAPYLEQIRQGNAGFMGRVVLLCLDQLRQALEQRPPVITEQMCGELAASAGVLGRAEDFVQTSEELAVLRRYLLGHTWFVDSFETALTLAPRYPFARFVTVAGEVVSGDGLVIAGPKSAITGLISRRSELRSLLRTLQEWDATCAALQEALESSRRALSQAEEQHTTLSEQRRRLAEELRDLEQKQRQAEQKLEETRRRLATIEAEIFQAEQICQQVQERQQVVLGAKREHEQMAQRLEQELGRIGQEIAQCENDVQEHNGVLTTLKVELAKSEERLHSLRREWQRQEQAAQERLRELADLQERFGELHRNWQEAERRILTIEASLAELYAAKDALGQQLLEATARREAIQFQRQELQQRLQENRRRLRSVEQARHQLELGLNSLRHEKSTLLQRMEEDHGISLAEIDQPPSPEETRDRATLLAAVEDLRRKIHHLGNVNLEALEELRQLEERYNTLSGQYQDLVSAKNSLLKIIERINADSRRLFAATLQTVSEHFATLFRDLFGGGQASIELEEGVDILESGIEIVARPPGKEPRNISLLSGGEKSLTCVALLLAIFRSRPSPFCVLDEVDAALDEANIDRFTRVLRDFLSLTQFVIVTHSKRTVTCADTIYGVTMEESGVSKRVAVRFEDLSDSGEILAVPPSRVGVQPAQSQDKAA